MNVFGFENTDILPLRITKHNGRQHHVNLLMIKNKNSSHYCLIKNLNSFLCRSKSCCRRQYFCPYCLQGFIREELLHKHQVYCSTNEPQRVVLPTQTDNILQFKDFEKELKVPFVIYADFETLNLKNYQSVRSDSIRNFKCESTIMFSKSGTE